MVKLMIHDVNGMLSLTYYRVDNGVSVTIPYTNAPAITLINGVSVRFVGYEYKYSEWPIVPEPFMLGVCPKFGVYE